MVLHLFFSSFIWKQLSEFQQYKWGSIINSHIFADELKKKQILRWIHATDRGYLTHNHTKWDIYNNSQVRWNVTKAGLYFYCVLIYAVLVQSFMIYQQIYIFPCFSTVQSSKYLTESNPDLDKYVSGGPRYTSLDGSIIFHFTVRSRIKC